MENYSILMSVYCKENPEFLRQSIESMLAQTTLTNNFVIVCDGSLTSSLDAVLNEYQNRMPDLVNIIRLPQNVGIGAAANAGLVQCTNDLIAKMDSDDVALPDRCELQLQCFAKDPGLAVVGGQLEEFEDQVDNIVAMRRVPLGYREIIQYAKRRMPFNNQTVMYRKSAVLEVGGYSAKRRCEDYDLYARLLFQGHRAQNIDKVIVLYRLNQGAYNRRFTVENLKGFVSVRWDIFSRGQSGLLDFVMPCAVQVLLTISPKTIKRLFYEKVLRA